MVVPNERPVSMAASEFSVDTDFLDASMSKIHSFSPGGNKMTPSNLAIVTTPTILRSKEAKAEQMLNVSSNLS